MRRAADPRLALLAALLAPTPAVGQALCSDPERMFFFRDYDMIRGTSGQQIAQRAAERNAQLFGIAREMETFTLPSLAANRFVFHYTAQQTYGAVKVPACTVYPPSHEGMRTRDVQTAAVDLGAYAIAGGFRFEEVPQLGLFFGTSATLMGLGGSDAGERIFHAGFLPLIASLTSPFVAPFEDQFAWNGGTMNLDFVAGAVWDNPAGLVSVGYLGSQGLFTNANEKHVRAFGTLALTELATRANIPYAALGVSSLDWLYGEKLTKWVGHTSFFGQKYDQVGAPTAPEDAAFVPERPRSLYTLNFAQQGIGRHLTVTAALALRPQAELYEASVALDLFPESDREIETVWNPAEVSGPTARLLVGVIELPDLWYYGREGGRRLRFAGEVGAGPYFVRLGMNDVQLLTAFPYAYDAFQVQISIGATAWPADD